MTGACSACGESLENWVTWNWERGVNEDGWECNCGARVPGEPPGYRPDLDVEMLDRKVDSILAALHEWDFIYVSNSSHGAAIVGAVTDACEKSGHRDQYSIIAAIMQQLDHGEFWKARGDGVRSGNDIRERCACGKLATVFEMSGGGVKRQLCGECNKQDPAWQR